MKRIAILSFAALLAVAHVGCTKTEEPPKPQDPPASAPAPEVQTPPQGAPGGTAPAVPDAKAPAPDAKAPAAEAPKGH